MCGFHLPLNAVKERYLVILLEGCVKGRGEVLHMVAHSARVSGVLATTLHTCRCQRKQSKVTTVISLPPPSLPPFQHTYTHAHTYLHAELVVLIFVSASEETVAFLWRGELGVGGVGGVRRRREGAGYLFTRFTLKSC